MIRTIPVCHCIRCYSCDLLTGREDSPCPGLQQQDVPESVACRLLTLGDGTVVQQAVTPVSLCSEEHFNTLRQRIAKTLRDGQGQVKCCYSNGCNSDMESVSRSLQYLDRPMNSAEIDLIQQKAENIQRLRELEQDRNKEILGRTSLGQADQQGASQITCFTCNLMDSQNYQPCPGAAPTAFPGSAACRVMSLSNGTVVQQAVTPVELCRPRHLSNLKRGVAKESYSFDPYYY